MCATATTYGLVCLLMSPETEDQRRSAAFQQLVRRPITAEALGDAGRAMRKRMTPVSLSAEAIDTCGTGGSGKKTFNTSTLTAFLLAAAGGKVAKHGNRSASGNCGTCDLLEPARGPPRSWPQRGAADFRRPGHCLPLRAPPSSRSRAAGAVAAKPTGRRPSSIILGRFAIRQTSSGSSSGPAILAQRNCLPSVCGRTRHAVP